MDIKQDVLYEYEIKAVKNYVEFYNILCII